VGIALKVKVRGIGLIEMLIRRELLLEDDRDVYKNLREARNAIAHGMSAMPSEAEAFEFVRQALYLQAKLNGVLEKLKS
jgi:hypothetical protein